MYRCTGAYRYSTVRFGTKTRIVYRTVPPSLEGVQRYTRCAKFQCKKKLDIYYSSVNILFLEIADLEKTSGDENETDKIRKNKRR